MDEKMILPILFCVSVLAQSGLIDASSVPSRNEASPRALEPFSFDDIFNSSLRPRGFSPRWVAGDGETRFYYRDTQSGNVMLHDAADDSETILIRQNQMVSTTYYVSSDLTHVLFAYNIQPLWRHSFGAKYQILNLQTDQLIPFPSGPLAGQELQYAQWSPSSLALSFVVNNNLYYQPSPTENPVQITSDGHPTDIFNGVPDWLYEEDVLSDRVSHYWSPDSRYICFAEINDTNVPVISWPLYGEKTDVYGRTREIKYPKAGYTVNDSPGPNSVVQLYLFDATNPVTSILVPPPDELKNQDHYFLQVVWANATWVYITWANRVQNMSFSRMYDATSLVPNPGLDFSVSKGWVEVPPPMPIFIDPENYITIHVREVNNQKWRNVVHVNVGGQMTFLTNEDSEEIDNIYAYDPVNKYVYYSSTNGDPTERHIKRVGSVDATDKDVVCLTCAEPDTCRYITSSFSSNAQHYFVNCRGPEIPTYALRSIADGGKNLVMESNSDVKTLLDTKALPTREFVDVPIGGGYMGRAEIFTPPDYTGDTTHPLLVYAYAGPGSQRVMKTFPMGSNTANWLTYLKSTHKVVIASVDSRGASGRGDNFKYEMYRKLGTVEVQDQIDLGRYFESNSMVDQNKAKAIFGWSYGGGTAGHVIGDPTQVFTCGISVAPVTTKMYYDTAYTERYLGFATTGDNLAGYNNTDIMNKVENFRDKNYLIAHGMADDNVHYMHATQLIQALARAEILFRQNAYIDQNHGIGDPGASRHLYKTMTDFLLNDCWPTTDGPISHGVTASISMALLVLMALLAVLLL